LCAQLRIDLILIAIPLEKVNQPRELLELCRQTTARVQVLPGFFDWLRSNGHAPAWIDLTDEEMLQRNVRETDRALGKKLLEGRVVLVTGAAGSIGSELCRQIASYAPRSLHLVDVNESGLYDLQVELRAQFKDALTQLALCDITDPLRLAAVFAETRPHIVFHAAAYKHVPILEDHPAQAVRVNVQGTQLVHSLAQEFSVERFILISSDKAVNPVNVLGMTKLLGEFMVAQEAGALPWGDNDVARTLSAAVRFGNVLGSRGSVLTIFEKQIALGGPVTITDSEMTRYFMSIDEAVNLVIQAAAMTRGNEVFLLDMGTPISILDLAHRVIRARGLRPEIDIPIQIIGARPGEKLSEELVAPGEEKIGTAHPSIFRIQRAGQIDPVKLGAQITRLNQLADQAMGKTELRFELESLVKSLHVATES
jgi:FlaA1/EpsC-like NDP-sugar epimerase